MSEIDDVAGRIAVFPGPLAIGSLEATAAAVTWFGEEAGDWLGETAIDAGDLDADGLADLAATSMGWPGHARRGRVYVGGLDTPDLASAEVVLDGETGNGHDFGRALAGGDFDGDGQGDLAVGAPSLYAGPERPGRVYLYLGPLVGPIAALEADQVWVGENGGDTAGDRVAFADLDGDGTDELVVSASRNDDDGPDVGKLYLLQDQPPERRPLIVLTPSTSGLSRSLGALCGRAVLSDPAGIEEPGLYGSSRLSAPYSTGSTPGYSLPGLNRTAHTLAVYASPRPRGLRHTGSSPAGRRGSQRWSQPRFAEGASASAGGRGL